jgi:hypothetical protein
MDVYLVPVGVERHKLYCEVVDDAADDAGEEPAGVLARLKHRFQMMLAEAERERRLGAPPPEDRGWAGRVRARTMRWVAESIAEQRLLWHLRSQTEASLHYPDDLEEHKAGAILRQQLVRDFDKHRFWLAIDAIGLVIAAVLTLIPGPNLLAYYFAFRLVGHYLSLRGAKRGLSGVVWQYQASAPLSELRGLLTLEPGAREGRVQAVAQRLRLEHLVTFFERSAVST